MAYTIGVNYFNSFWLKKIQELEKAKVKDKEQIAIFEKIVTRSLFGNINASRNSA